MVDEQAGLLRTLYDESCGPGHPLDGHPLFCGRRVLVRGSPGRAEAALRHGEAYWQA
jgi:hypothetical protein